MKITTVEKILIGFDPQKNNLLPALREISAAFGYISATDATKIADYFSLSEAEVFEMASFYDLIKTEKGADLVIRVCSGTNCATKGAFQLIREIENYFGIRAGDEFNPGVKLEIISCLGRCGDGPVVVINGKVFEHVTMGKLREILESIG